MIDWDDVRFFHAIAKGGSVRAAADQLGVNHSTVLRRVAHLEQRLSAQLFDKLPSGYRLTEAGEEVRVLAEQMEVSSNQLESRILGRDQSVRGLLRVTMPPALATHLLMADFAAFARLHSEIEVDVHPSDDPLNLTNRQADIALRVVYETTSLPLNLHGLKGPVLFGAVFIAKDRLAEWRADPSRPVRWVVKDFDGIPDWGREGDVPIATVPFRTSDSGAHIAALRQGIGMSTLPCFVGDQDPDLVRVPGTRKAMHGTLWLLTQGDTRKTKRVRLFIDFIAGRLTAYAPLLAGALAPEESAEA